MYAVMINEAVEKSDVYIFDSETAVLELDLFEQVVAEQGWERASELAFLSEQMKKTA
jgi:predicted nucleotidyltransferase